MADASMTHAPSPDVLDAFHPSLAAWFRRRFGDPTDVQRRGWPLIQSGANTLIAAPTGSGKTLTGFLSAIDVLLREGRGLPDETRVVYVSPLRALSNDVQKNLEGPLAELRALDADFPDLRVQVRTGDTPATQRAAMSRRPPHLLVTTPESLYILLTSSRGRESLRTVRTVIIDEIHALVRDKRGAHLALSLERLEALTERPLQRIGLSATQKPLSDVGAFLAGRDRECAIVDAGSFRYLDLAIEVPPSALQTVCSHEQWDEIYRRIADLAAQHTTTLIFVNTRKLAERVSAQLARLLGEGAVTSHHGSLSRERRLEAERLLKSGSLRALVATASLELGIDIGDVDLVVQVGATRSIATLLQRVGRAGHGVGRTPKGRIFPLTVDELVEAGALLRCVREGLLDRTSIPTGALDVLAQQVVAECVAEAQDESALYERFRSAHPYQSLSRREFDEVLELHADGGRRVLLHRDSTTGRVRATPRARLTAIRSGGAIPDLADYQVLLEPEGTLVGTVNEDWAIESSAGDVFQLGNTSWRIARVSPGVVRVIDAKGQPPSLPFWLGEAPGRTRELSNAIAVLREEVAGPNRSEGLHAATQRALALVGSGLSEGGAIQLAEYVLAGRAALGEVPTQRRVILERFFDESGGTQLVVHAPFGSRINRAWGLALRKRFCVGFGFELQAAANEEAIVVSLGLQHSFVLDDVFDFLREATAREVLVQALLAAPMFTTRWRWNVQRSLLLERFMGSGRKMPANLARMKAEDLLVAAFPQVLACPETLPGGPIPVPDEHPIVRQTVEDCLNEAMDLDGVLDVLRGLHDGTIERIAVDTAEPSAFARGILSSQPYTFLDDAPLEERRTQAVMTRRILDVQLADDLGALDPVAVARVREEAWPSPLDADDVHAALLWMGFVRDDEATHWRSWLGALEAAGRVVHTESRWFAIEVGRDPLRCEPKALLRGRLEALGPFEAQEDSPDYALLLQLEAEGVVLRTRLDGARAWCERRLLARIHRYTLDKLRREIEPVSLADFGRFLRGWQHLDEEFRLDGPAGVRAVIDQLAGFEIPAAAWESQVLAARVRGYKPEWLDEVMFTGSATWARLWGAASTPVSRTPIALFPREELPMWGALAANTTRPDPGPLAASVLAGLRDHGALFVPELMRVTRLDRSATDEALGELVASGRVTCDTFAGLRALIAPSQQPQHARFPIATGRWSLLRSIGDQGKAGRDDPTAPDLSEHIARQLLRRTGIVFRRTLARERLPVPWRDIARACRRLETRGEVRGGRFVAGVDGEQYALAEAVALMRQLRRRPTPLSCPDLPSTDPLHDLLGRAQNGPAESAPAESAPAETAPAPL